MHKKEFTKLEESLTKRGYKKFNNRNHFEHEDYYLYKSFHKEDNRWKEGRSAVQILLYVYDYTDSPYPVPPNMKNHVGIDVHIDVSRTVNERADMVLTWHDDTTIEEIEKLAESFYSWVVCMMPEPRKD